MVLEAPKYQYWLDASDAVVRVDEQWLAFARENGADELIEALVLGRSIWDFIEGESTRNIYRQIHARVRTDIERVVLPFRCDSPTLQRHMRLTITRGERGELAYESLLVRAVSQRYLSVLDHTKKRTSAVLTMCTNCKRCLLESVGWIGVEDISARLRLFDSPEVPKLRHTVCPQCASALQFHPDNGNAA